MTSRPITRKPFPISKIVVPVVTVGILFALWRLGYKWAALPVVLFVLFYFLVLPGMVRKRTERFNRKALSLLTTGKAAALPGLVRRSVFLQLFGPRGPLDAKLALAYVQCEAYHNAVPCFESGMSTAPLTERVALQSGLVKALFATGDLGRAESEARSIVDNYTRLPELLAIMARARIGLGKTDDTTRLLLDEAAALSPSSDVNLMIELSRIEMALASGRKAPAFPEQADSGTKLIRSWIHAVRGMLRESRGDSERALESFQKAKNTLPDSLFAKLSDTHIDALTATTDKNGSAGEAIDPAIRRKKQRRRR